MFHELAMFLFFIAEVLNILTVESGKELIAYTDSDFLKYCNFDTKRDLLSKWFVKNIIQSLDSKL